MAITNTSARASGVQVKPENLIRATHEKKVGRRRNLCDLLTKLVEFECEELKSVSENKEKQECQCWSPKKKIEGRECPDYDCLVVISDLFNQA